MRNREPVTNYNDGLCKSLTLLVAIASSKFEDVILNPMNPLCPDWQGMSRAVGNLSRQLKSDLKPLAQTKVKASFGSVSKVLNKSWSDRLVTYREFRNGKAARCSRINFVDDDWS